MSEVRTCERCQNPLNRKQKAFCSTTCHAPPVPPTKCKTCKKTFTPDNNRSHSYCSQPCYWQGKKVAVNKYRCNGCKAVFTRPIYIPPPKFCSIGCSNRSHKNTGYQGRKTFTVQRVK